MVSLSLRMHGMHGMYVMQPGVWGLTQVSLCPAGDGAGWAEGGPSAGLPHARCCVPATRFLTHASDCCAQGSDCAATRGGSDTDDEAQAWGREDQARRELEEDRVAPPLDTDFVVHDVSTATLLSTMSPRRARAASNEADALEEAMAAAEEAAEHMPSLGQVHMYDRTERRFSGACPCLCVEGGKGLEIRGSQRGCSVQRSPGLSIFTVWASQLWFPTHGGRAWLSPIPQPPTPA